MIKIREINNEEVYDILKYDYEEDLELICTILSKRYSVQIIDKQEGPGTTIWILKVNGIDVFLVNNSYGNFFRPETDDAKDFFKEEQDSISKLLS